ncbi:MAG TPA: ATP-binding protein [Myxococcaceae bacterium]|jgi:signal transduction histidine kinase
MGSLDQGRKRRSLRAALEEAAIRLEAESRFSAQLQRLLEIGKILVRFERFDEIWPQLMSLAAKETPLCSAILIPARDPEQPLAWWTDEVGAEERREGLVRAHARLASLCSQPTAVPAPEEPRAATHPLLGLRGEALGVFWVEWRRTPVESDLAFAASLGDQFAAALDRHARDEAIRSQQARGTERACENLLAMVSHELRNLLSVVTTNLSLLREYAMSQASGQLQGTLTRIQRASGRMRHLVDDLLDTACIEAERLPIDPQRLEVATLVAEALESAAPLAAARSLQLRNEVPADLPPVRADGVRIQQVFANLLGNAIKFSPEGETISVGARRSGADVEFRVVDHGCGVVPEDEPYLFDRYWQARHSSKVGFGLGLFIVKGIVQAHGGRVWVESRSGAGATFFFTVPAAEPAQLQEAGGAPLSAGPEPWP